jgi:hypothetical protein
VVQADSQQTPSTHCFETHVSADVQAAPFWSSPSNSAVADTAVADVLPPVTKSLPPEIGVAVWSARA